MELNVEGKWWFPSDNTQLPGTLTFGDSGSLLTVSGPFLPSAGINSSVHQKDFIILGELVDGKKVSLVAYNMGN